MTAAAAARNVRRYFNVRSETNESAAEKKRWSVNEEDLVTSEFSEELMEGEVNLQNVKKKMLSSPLRHRASPKQV